MALKEGERFNVDTMEIEKIPVAEPKAEAPAPDGDQEETEETSDEESEQKTDEKEKPSEESTKQEQPKESEEQETESTEESEPPDANEQSEAIDVDDFIRDEYKKYEIKSKEDLDGVLDSIDNLMNHNHELEIQLKAAQESPSEPQFKSEAQKKLWEFMQDIDPDKLGERLQTYSNLVAIDPEKGDPRLILQEQYILQHPAWTRDEAIMKFDRAYKRNYTANKDDFDNDEEYNDELKSKELDMKDDVMKARDFLKKQQEQFKAKPKDEEKPVENVALKRTIEQTVSEVDGYDFTELIFSPTDDKEDDYSVKLSDQQIKEIKNSLKAWVSNPNSYDKKGELFGGWDVEQKSVQVAFMLFGPDIVQKNYEHAINLKNITRAEEIATRKPDRKAKTAGDNPTGQLSEEKQWEMAIKKKKANANNRQMVYR